ncbi:MAG: rhodanese-like domain-containing protein, partial [Pseudomonadota bacterium]
MALTRRTYLIGGACLVGAAVGGGYVYLGPAAASELSPPEAHEQALAGDILLIDIRRPDEWAATGIAEGAVPLDMRRSDFTKALTDLADGDVDRPIAVMCARGAEFAGCGWS